MQDLDWYIDLGGKKSGPFAVEDIIARYKNGEIPTSAYVTAQRMKGEWVRITDLAEAYRDLFQLNDGPTLNSPAMNIPPAPQTRTNIPRPTTPTTENQRQTMPSVSELTSPKVDRSSSSSRFQAPPRPTEQLEASKLITLNPPGAGSANPDATESLFQAIQAIREKNQMKTHAPTRDSWGELSRPKRPIPAQSSLYIVLIGILLTAAYATYRIIESRKEEVEKQQAAALALQKPTPPPAPPTPTPAAASTKLLNDPSAHSAGSSGSRYSSPTRTKSINSPAGGNIRLSAPKRIDDEDTDSPQVRDEDEDTDSVEPVEENPAPHPVRTNQNSGSYPIEGAEPDDGSGEVPPKPPILENAIDPATGQPLNQ